MVRGSVAYGSWFVACGLWVCGLWFVALLPVAYGSWFVAYGLWVCGLWFVVQGFEGGDCFGLEEFGIKN